MRPLLVIFWALFLLASVPSSSQNVPFTPATLINVKIIPTVSFDPSSPQRFFTYHYQINSLPDSQQFVWWFDVSTGIKAVTIISTPTYWLGDDNPPERMVFGWVAEGDPNAPPQMPDLTPDGQIPGSIPPGGSLGDFAATSCALPGIEMSFTRGFAPLPHVDWVTRDTPPIPDVLDDAVKINTVGPDTLPNNRTPAQLLDRLISLKEQAFQAGWIDNQGVANSLDVKLKEVKIKLQAGQTKVAGNILKSFILDLIAQHQGQTGQGTGQGNPQGKHVNDNAFYLLKPNAEFILYKLGATNIP